MNPVIDVAQGSSEWLTMRAGMVTASRVGAVIGKLKKGGYSAARQDYLMETVVGRLTGLNAEHFVTPAMAFGIENEPFAVAAFEMEQDVAVDLGGFAIHPTIKWFGASPDRTIGDDALLECKCPNSDTHLSYILEGVVPEQYKPQMLAQMACTGRQYCFFCSFDPRLPKKLQLFIRRFDRDEAKITELENEVKTFLLEVDAMIDRLNEAVTQ